MDVLSRRTMARTCCSVFCFGLPAMCLGESEQLSLATLRLGVSVLLLFFCLRLRLFDTRVGFGLGCGRNLRPTNHGELCSVINEKRGLFIGRTAFDVTAWAYWDSLPDPTMVGIRSYPCHSTEEAGSIAPVDLNVLVKLRANEVIVLLRSIHKTRHCLSIPVEDEMGQYHRLEFDRQIRPRSWSARREVGPNCKRFRWFGSWRQDC